MTTAHDFSTYKRPIDAVFFSYYYFLRSWGAARQVLEPKRARKASSQLLQNDAHVVSVSRAGIQLDSQRVGQIVRCNATINLLKSKGARTAL